MRTPDVLNMEVGAGLQAELSALLDAMSQRRRVLVAFSGGVDSSLVAKVACMALGDGAVAVTAVADTLASGELDVAKRVAREIGIRHRTVAYNELDDPEYAANPANRCFFCRRELARHLRPVAQEEGFSTVASGVLASDFSEYRPGIQAMDEAGFWHPLAEFGFDKTSTRSLAKRLGLSVWDKPTMACLSSRIPHGERITLEKLGRVDRAETLIRHLGFRQVRVRHVGGVARVEVPYEEIPRLSDPRVSEEVRLGLMELGFLSVEIDSRGYRSGRLNETSGPNPSPSS